MSGAQVPNLKKSLPPRERELKLARAGAPESARLSLPPRERELKLGDEVVDVDLEGSLPPRERELKPLILVTMK